MERSIERDPQLSHLSLARCLPYTVVLNRIAVATQGALAHMTACSSLTMHNCTIVGCTAKRYYFSRERNTRDIIFLSSTWFSLTDCSFRSNKALGGAMLAYASGNGSRPVFARTTFVGNSGSATVDFKSPLTWECQARASRLDTLRMYMRARPHHTATCPTDASVYFLSGSPGTGRRSQVG
jgi:hypothetical protein